MIPRLLDRYRNQIVPKMVESFGYKNKMQVPKITKICINMGVGVGSTDIKILESVADNLALIVGQRGVITRAKKAIANFKIKQGMPIGCKVTLRGSRMYEFLDRLVNIAVPRIKDFRGIPATSFDGRGNFSFGVTEQLIFSEIDYDKVTKTQGMDITIVTTAKNNEEAHELLKLFGVPFRQ